MLVGSNRQLGSAKNPYGRSELRASANEASQKLKRRARKPAKACGESGSRRARRESVAKVHVCSFCVARESSAKVIIAKHMPAKVKRVAAKASGKVARKRFVSRGFYVPSFMHVDVFQNRPLKMMCCLVCLAHIGERLRWCSSLC